MSELVTISPQENLWPYSERNSVGIEGHIQELLTEPTNQLDIEQLQEVRAFSDAVCKGNTIDGVECEARRSLEALLAFSVLKDVQVFDLDYFKTDEGANDLAKLGVKTGASDDDLKTHLYDIQTIDERLGEKGRKEMATRTTDYRRDVIAAGLADTAANDENYEAGKSVVVAYKPDELLDKLQDLQAHRKYLRQVLGDVKSETPTDTRDAKVISTEILLARTNSMTAELYPAAIALAQQLDQAPASATSQQLVARLCDVAPFLSRAFKSEVAMNAQQRATFFANWKTSGLRKIDYLTNGIGHSDGKFSPIDSAVITWADTYKPDEIDMYAEKAFSDEELAVMDKTVWGAKQTKEFGEAIIGEWDLLSTHQSNWEDVENRNEPAPDNKWQVVITPRTKTLSVNGFKKVVLVPEKMQRTLTQVSEAGVVPLLGHESGHVLQNEFDQQLADQVPAAAIKGRRSATMRELGGVMEEAEVQASFGRVRPTNLHYLRALQAKEAGGNPMQVARAFFESLCPDTSTISDDQLTRMRKQAADRSRRFYRGGGHNTQPLEYVEQGYARQIIGGLPVAERKALVIAGGSFAPSDAAALHRYGLLILPKNIDKDPAQTAIRVFRRDYLPQLMTA